MRLMTLATLVLAVSFGAASDAGARPAHSVRESFARLQHAVRSEDPHGFCELIFPSAPDLTTRGLERELRSLRTPKGRARYEKFVNKRARQTTRSTVAKWQPAVLGLSILSVRTHGDMATARARTRTGPGIRIQFVDAAGEWRLLSLSP